MNKFSLEVCLVAIFLAFPFGVLAEDGSDSGGDIFDRIRGGPSVMDDRDLSPPSTESTPAPDPLADSSEPLDARQIGDMVRSGDSQGLMREFDKQTRDLSEADKRAILDGAEDQMNVKKGDTANQQRVELVNEVKSQIDTRRKSSNQKVVPTSQGWD